MPGVTFLLCFNNVSKERKAVKPEVNIHNIRRKM